MRADVSNTAELLSKEFENWDYAAARYHSSPFTWINAGPLESSYDDARPPSYVQTQLTASAQVRDGRRLRELPLRRRAHALVVRPVRRHHAGRRHARERRRDRPTLHAAATAGKIHGTAHDNLAVWVVRWRDNLGGRGVAELDFTITEGDMLYIKDWQMDWSVPREALTDGASSVTVHAVDIKRNISAPRVVTLGRAGDRRRGPARSRAARALSTSSAAKHRPAPP